ncbi:unnamed protein product [Bursaphelenchus xylophilus]|uniref:Serpentine receptor class gamma n=1 Tax=Bursaphelenchus xylophilus TaxID=6326 RepID=A0A1I7RLK3_BURXY|nr:unnamed protein product [Bursaphelenchus xylophilus]CAG9082896.1 unnamed protein product [Bursaphelenchus xylophilus]
MHISYNFPQYASMFLSPDDYLYIFWWRLSLLEFLINYCGMVTLCGTAFLALNRWSSITKGVRHSLWWTENIKCIYLTCLTLPLCSHYGFLFTRSSYILESNDYVTVYSEDMEIICASCILIHPRIITPFIDLTFLVVCLLLNGCTVIVLRSKWESATKDKQWKVLTIICVADMVSHILWAGYDVMGYVAMNNKSLEVWTFTIYPFIDDLDPFICGWVLICCNRKIRSKLFRSQSLSHESFSQKPILVAASRPQPGLSYRKPPEGI